MLSSCAIQAPRFDSPWGILVANGLAFVANSNGFTAGRVSVCTAMAGVVSDCALQGSTFSNPGGCISGPGPAGSAIPSGRRRRSRPRLARNAHTLRHNHPH